MTLCQVYHGPDGSLIADMLSPIAIDSNIILKFSCCFEILLLDINCNPSELRIFSPCFAV